MANPVALPETNISQLKMDDWKTKILIKPTLKFNMSPLKSYRNPIGKACFPTTIFQGRTVKLREGRLYNLVYMGANVQSRMLPQHNKQTDGT